MSLCGYQGRLEVSILLWSFDLESTDCWSSMGKNLATVLAGEGVTVNTVSQTQ